MGRNRQLEAIKANWPDYEECQKRFLQHLCGFQKLGAVNYAALLHGTGWNGATSEIIGYFLVGMALGRAMEIAEQDDNTIDVYNPLEAWKLVEDELAVLLPEPEKGKEKEKEGAK